MQILPQSCFSCIGLCLEHRLAGRTSGSVSRILSTVGRLHLLLHFSPYLPLTVYKAFLRGGFRASLNYCHTTPLGGMRFASSCRQIFARTRKSGPTSASQFGLEIPSQVTSRSIPCKTLDLHEITHCRSYCHHHSRIVISTLVDHLCSQTFQILSNSFLNHS